MCASSLTNGAGVSLSRWRLDLARPAISHPRPNPARNIAAILWRSVFYEKEQKPRRGRGKCRVEASAFLAEGALFFNLRQHWHNTVPSGQESERGQQAQPRSPPITAPPSRRYASARAHRCPGGRRERHYLPPVDVKRERIRIFAACDLFRRRRALRPTRSTHGARGRHHHLYLAFPRPAPARAHSRGCLEKKRRSDAHYAQIFDAFSATDPLCPQLSDVF